MSDSVGTGRNPQETNTDSGLGDGRDPTDHAQLQVCFVDADNAYGFFSAMVIDVCNRRAEKHLLAVFLEFGIDHQRAFDALGEVP